MLSQETNELITSVNKASPAGELLRRYWYPVFGTKQIVAGSIKKIQLLGDNFVLFRDLSGKLGLISERCAHRGVSLESGIVEADGIRCPYHGWKFSSEGNCVEIPHAPENARFKQEAKLGCGVLREIGGLIFAYIGPTPVPGLPLIDAFSFNCKKKIKYALLPCNWFQIMENSFDPIHLEWVHGHYHNYKIPETDNCPYTVTEHEEVEFLSTEYGFVKRRILKGQSKEEDDWQVGQQIFFPNISRLSKAPKVTLHIKVPLTDQLTAYYWYECDISQPTPTGDEIEWINIEYLNHDGTFRLNTLEEEDIMIFMSQEAIIDRSKEHLYEIDKGIIKFRKKFLEQIDEVASGRKPLFVKSDINNEVLNFPLVKPSHSRSVLEFMEKSKSKPNN